MITQKRTDYQFLIGEYRRLYFGHSAIPTERSSASSGGVISAVCKQLLESGRVDAILGVGFSNSHPIQAEYQAIEDAKDLPSIAGSKYVYMKWHGLFELLQRHQDKKLVVIAQPCFIPKIRKLQGSSMPNIRYVLSFFCGYNMSAEATSYLLEKSGTPLANVRRIDYRGGSYPGGFTVYRTDGSVSQWNKECYEYTNLAFLHRPCRLCKLYFGEMADIAFGDAWLREHEKLTAIIARTVLGDELLREMNQARSCKLYQLPEKLLIDMHWHNAKVKKVRRPFTIRLATKMLADIIPHGCAPFFWFMRISKYRRSLFMGVSHPRLEEIVDD